MGRVSTNITVSSLAKPKQAIRCKALVDTGSAFLTLPSDWKNRFNSLDRLREVTVELGNQTKTAAEVWGAVRLEIEGCKPIYTEVLFIDMVPDEGKYEPLLGYIPMEQSQVAVDMATERLVPVKYVDLK